MNCQLLIEPLMQKVNVMVLDKNEIQNRDLYLLILSLPFWASPDLDAKNDEFSFENFPSGNTLSTETLINEIKHMFSEKNEFQHPAKNNTFCFFRHAGILEHGVPGNNIFEIVFF